MTERNTKKRETILLVGREPMLAGALVHLLDEREIDVRVSRDPDDALSKFWQHHFPVVAIDLTVPGVNAVAVARGLKGEPGSPKVIVIGPEEALADLRRALPKEHRPDELLHSAIPTEVVADRIAAHVRPPTPEGVLQVSAADPSFAGLLTELWRRSATGVLELEGDLVRTTVFFMNGEPVFAEHGAPADSLGRTLVRTGLITELQLTRALERMATRAAPSEQMRLGEVLIELGVLTPDQVHEAIRQQVRHKLLACFQWRSVRHGYHEQSDFFRNIGIFKCQVPKLLLEGIRRWYDPARVAAILGPRIERYPRLRSDLASVASRFALGAVELRLLRSITGTRTIGRILDSNVLERAAASHLVTALLLTDELELWTEPATRDVEPTEGSIDIAPRPPSGTQPSEDGGFIVAEYLRLKGKSDAEVLRVRPDANEGEIAVGFAAGAARFGPEATRNLAPHLARKASEIYALMGASRDRMLVRAERRRLSLPEHSPGSGDLPRLVEPPPASEGSDAKPALIAEAAYQRGKHLLTENALAEAREELRRAAAALPDAPEIQLLAEYTEYLVAADDAGRRVARDRAKAWAEKTLAADPRHAKAHAILGRFFRLEGQLDEAEKHLLAAQSYDPSDRLLEVELGLLQKQQAERGKKKRAR